MKRQASRTHVNRTVSRKPLKNSSKLFTPNGYWLPQLFLSNGTIIRISPPSFASKATTFPSPESMQIMPAVCFRLNAHKPTTKRAALATYKRKSSTKGKMSRDQAPKVYCALFEMKRPGSNNWPKQESKQHQTVGSKQDLLLKVNANKGQFGAKKFAVKRS